MDGYNGGGRHYRYNMQRNYIQHKQKKSPVALIVISIILLISTVVLSIALLKTNKDTPVVEEAVVSTPIATPQPTTDNRASELTALMQLTIDQAAEGELTVNTRSTLEKHGMSAESLDLLESTIGQTPSESQYNDGSFIGIAEGDRGKIEVEVTISNGNILYVSVLEHSEKSTSELKEAFRSIPLTILLNQSTNGIDAVSGATQVSEGLIGAIDDALSGAKK